MLSVYLLVYRLLYHKIFYLRCIKLVCLTFSVGIYGYLPIIFNRVWCQEVTAVYVHSKMTRSPSTRAHYNTTVQHKKDQAVCVATKTVFLFSLLKSFFSKYYIGSMVNGDWSHIKHLKFWLRIKAYECLKQTFVNVDNKHLSPSIQTYAEREREREKENTCY